MNNLEDRRTDESPNAENSEINGNLTIKRNKKLDIIAKIGCIVIAVVIWFYASGSDASMTESTITDIPISVTNNGEMSVVSDGALYVDVTVRGKRSAVSSLSSSDITAYVDISDVTTPGTQSFSVRFKLPSGVTRVSSSTSSVTLYIDRTSVVSVPVKVKVIDFMLEDGFELGESDITTDPKTITVSGPESALSEIDHAQLKASIGKVSGTVTYAGKLTLVDKNGSEITSTYMKLSSEEATAVIPVYTYATIPINVEYKYGYFNSSNTSVSVNPSTIRVKGDAAAIANAKCTYVIDEKQISANGTYTFMLSLSDGLISVDGINTAQITIRNSDIITKTVSVTGIGVTNPNGLNYEILTESVSVRLRGPSALINQIRAEDVILTADLGDIDASDTNALIPLTVSFASKYSGKVYELGSYSVSVKISEK